MKKLLSLVSFAICSMLFCFVPQISVYAVGDSWTDTQKYTYFQNNFDDINTRLNGVIINQNRLEESFEDYLSEYRENNNISGSNQDFISNNTNISYQNGSSGDAVIEFSQTLRQVMRDWIDAYLDSNTGFIYGYSVGTAQFSSIYPSQTDYHNFLNFVSDHDSSILIGNLYSTGYFYQIYEITGNKPQFVLKNTSNGIINTSVSINWSTVQYTDYVIWSYDTSTHEWISTTPSQGSAFPWRQNIYFKESIGITSLQDACVLDLNSSQYIIYKSDSAMRNGTEGIQDYYTVSDSYNSSISGSYNTTTNNVSNTLTNSDVNNYINNYYVQNGSYPTPNQVNVYITNNIDNGSDSGGGSGGDNGGGSDNSNIWEFLDSIGEFIGHLISSLGEVLSGILSLLTDVIDLFIGEEGLPNVFSQLVSYYLGFLPEEFLRLIELFVVCVLIVGVIKLIRGS